MDLTTSTSVSSLLKPRFGDSSRHCWFAGSEFSIFTYTGISPKEVLIVLNRSAFQRDLFIPVGFHVNCLLFFLKNKFLINSKLSEDF
jgi:hypothetical protein